MDWPPSLRFEFLGSLSTLHTSVFADGKSKPRVWRMMGRVAGTKMGSRQTALCREFLIRRHRLPLEGVPAWRSHCQRKLRVSMSPPTSRPTEARRGAPASPRSPACTFQRRFIGVGSPKATFRAEHEGSSEMLMWRFSSSGRPWEGWEAHLSKQV